MGFTCSSATTSPGSSLVVYEVHLSLAESSLPILIGMTADANLITVEKEEVLLVSNRAINVDRSNGTYNVNLIVGDSVEEVPVTLGLRDNQFTQITSGLNTGDQLQIGSSVPKLEFGPGSGRGPGN